VGGGAYGAEELLARRVLQKVSGGTGLDGAQDVRVGVVGGQDVDVWVVLLDPAYRLYTVHLGHAQVHQDYVRAQ
jgi:hypothetical protein